MITRIDDKVHAHEIDYKLIVYQRIPDPKELTSFDDTVRCGSIRDAVRNEIPRKQPTIPELAAEETVPHDKLAGRAKSATTPAASGSNHQSRK